MILACVVACGFPSTIPESQQQALVDLYVATDGDHWTDNSGWLDANVNACEWFGVTCPLLADDQDTYVSEIQLQSNNLAGTLPGSFATLANMYLLDLRNNSISGPIPGTLGDCADLVTIDLSMNSLSLGVPPYLPPRLGYLYLQANALTGSIPDSWSGLVSVELGNNGLSGTVPEWLSYLLEQQWDASGNCFTCPLPSWCEYDNCKNSDACHGSCGRAYPETPTPTVSVTRSCSATPTPTRTVSTSPSLTPSTTPTSSPFVPKLCPTTLNGTFSGALLSGNCDQQFTITFSSSGEFEATNNYYCGSACIYEYTGTFTYDSTSNLLVMDTKTCRLGQGSYGMCTLYCYPNGEGSAFVHWSQTCECASVYIGGTLVTVVKEFDGRQAQCSLYLSPSYGEETSNEADHNPAWILALVLALCFALGAVVLLLSAAVYRCRSQSGAVHLTTALDASLNNDYQTFGAE